MDNEPDSTQDARVEALWASLDTEGNGQIDLAALKTGLRKLDHRNRHNSDVRVAVADCPSFERCGRAS